MPGGVRLKYGNPMDIDDVAVDFPAMSIMMAHPSFPGQDEAIELSADCAGSLAGGFREDRHP